MMEKGYFFLIISIVKNTKQATNMPLSVDIESGFAKKDKNIITNILSLAEIGCLSINI